MKKFETPKMEVQKLAAEDVFTTQTSDCRTEALGCESCYCVGVVCDDFGCAGSQTCDCYDFF